MGVAKVGVNHVTTVEVIMSGKHLMVQYVDERASMIGYHDS